MEISDPEAVENLIISMMRKGLTPDKAADLCMKVMQAQEKKQEDGIL